MIFGRKHKKETERQTISDAASHQEIHVKSQAAQLHMEGRVDLHEGRAWIVSEQTQTDTARFLASAIDLVSRTGLDFVRDHHAINHDEFERRNLFGLIDSKGILGTENGPTIHEVAQGIGAIAAREAMLPTDVYVEQLSGEELVARLDETGSMIETEEIQAA